MNPATPFRSPAVFAAAAFAWILAAPPSRGGGFALIEQNASGAGTCWSDAAAAADASTVFFNPAGMAWLKRPEAVVAGHGISARVKFRDAGSTTAGAIPLDGGSGGDAGGVTPLPNFYYAAPLSPTWAAGVGLSVPWGLSTDYAAGWAGRYQALKSELRTVNLTAAVSWRVVPELALGLGMQRQQATVELGNAIDFGLVGYQLGLAGWLPGRQDGEVRVQGSAAATGAVASLLYEPQPGTRVGLSFRSKLTHSFVGDAVFTHVPAAFAAGFPNQKARSQLATPATVSIHAMQDIEAWRFTAAATWWQFGCFRTLAVDFENAATPDLAQAQDWKTAGIYAVGAAYRWSEAFTLRFGAAYNSTPVPSAERRNPRIPDGNRRWLSVGGAWRATPELTVEAGYVHLFFGDAAVNHTDAFAHQLRGDFKLAADLFSVQGSLRF